VQSGRADAPDDWTPSYSWHGAEKEETPFCGLCQFLSRTKAIAFLPRQARDKRGSAWQDSLKHSIGGVCVAFVCA